MRLARLQGADELAPGQVGLDQLEAIEASIFLGTNRLRLEPGPLGLAQLNHRIAPDLDGQRCFRAGQKAVFRALKNCQFMNFVLALNFDIENPVFAAADLLLNCMMLFFLVISHGLGKSFNTVSVGFVADA